MARLYRILALALALAPVFSSAQTGDRDELLRDMVRLYGQAEVKVAMPGSAMTDLLSRNLSISSATREALFIRLSPLTLDWFISRKLDYSIIEGENLKGDLSAENTAMAMEWQSYPTLPQYDSILKYFHSNYPSLCDIDTIGTSVRGRKILALKISDNVSTDEDEPEVFLTSTMHGDETAGLVLLLRFASYLLENYYSQGDIRNLVDGLEIWINPLANPDGTYGNGDEITLPVRFNANGYDLNRNFPDPESNVVEIQNETAGMIDFMKQRSFVISVNFHSGAEVINYPWDRWERLHADDEWFRAISRSYVDTVHFYSEPGYMTDLDDGITNGYQWYNVYGGRQDYVTWELGGREVTVELHKSYVTPVEQLEYIWESHYRSLKSYIGNAFNGIHGRIIDRFTGLPLAASVVIDNHDRDNSYIESDTLTGRFIRMIAPGSWPLKFSAMGYRDTVIMVLSPYGEKTDLEVKMYPLLNRVDTLDHETPFLYPNPASTYLKAVLPADLRGELRVTIFSVSGKKEMEYETVVSGDFPLTTDISRLQRGTFIIVFTNKVSGLSSKAVFIIARHP